MEAFGAPAQPGELQVAQLPGRLVVTVLPQAASPGHKLWSRLVTLAFESGIDGTHSQYMGLRYPKNSIGERVEQGIVLPEANWDSLAKSLACPLAEGCAFRRLPGGLFLVYRDELGTPTEQMLARLRELCSALPWGIDPVRLARPAYELYTCSPLVEPNCCVSEIQLRLPTQKTTRALPRELNSAA